MWKGLNDMAAQAESTVSLHTQTLTCTYMLGADEKRRLDAWQGAQAPFKAEASGSQRHSRDNWLQWGSALCSVARLDFIANGAASATIDAAGATCGAVSCI